MLRITSCSSLGKFAENPAVQAGQFVIRDRVLGGIEIVEIRKLVAQRVAHDRGRSRRPCRCALHSLRCRCG